MKYFPGVKLAGYTGDVFESRMNAVFADGAGTNPA